MPPKSFLGEFEQMGVLAILQPGGNAYGLEVRKELERSAEREVSRCEFYKTLDRLESKRYVSWKTAASTGERGGMPQRLFKVTPAGVRALRHSRKALMNLWRGLDNVLGES